MLKIIVTRSTAAPITTSANSIGNLLAPASWRISLSSCFWPRGRPWKIGNGRVDAQASERLSRERYALLKKIAEQPTGSADRVLEILREEDARASEKERKKELRARRNSLQAGALLVAFGLGVATMFAIARPHRAEWVMGLVPIFLGVVVLGFNAWQRES